VITASLGFGAFRTPSGNKCLMMANFVLSICCIVADFAIIIGAIVYFGLLNAYMARESFYRSERPYMAGGYMAGEGFYRSEQPPSAEIRFVRGLKAAESLLLLAAITHLISCIVSNALICGNLYCRRGEPPVTVVVCPPRTDPAFGSETTNSSRIIVPHGTRVQYMTTPAAPPQ